MAEKTTSARIQGIRILAVDDEPDILETIVEVLDGATVDCARSYEEATERLSPGESRTPANLKYDLAILDIMGVDGMALLTQTVNQRIPTVMLTAHAMNPQTLKASIVNGALSYLPKSSPISPSTSMMFWMRSRKDSRPGSGCSRSWEDSSKRVSDLPGNRTTLNFGNITTVR